MKWAISMNRECTKSTIDISNKYKISDRIYILTGCPPIEGCDEATTASGFMIRAGMRCSIHAMSGCAASANAADAAEPLGGIVTSNRSGETTCTVPSPLNGSNGNNRLASSSAQKSKCCEYHEFNEKKKPDEECTSGAGTFCQNQQQGQTIVLI
jgi:hypothetical protein